MAKEKFNIIDLVNNDSCFDLQFRKDTRHERTNSPTYYRWKSQFVVTVPKEQIKILEKTKKVIYQNKGVYLSKWPKNDLLHLLEIHKAMAKHKNKPRKQKWTDMAQAIT